MARRDRLAGLGPCRWRRAGAGLVASVDPSTGGALLLGTLTALIEFVAGPIVIEQ
jgi:hypothetical protein